MFLPLSEWLIFSYFYFIRKNLKYFLNLTPSQKFNRIRISVLRSITKIGKKLIIFKKSKTYILHNNYAEKLLTN